MYKKVKIGDKTVPMLANGATPIRYRMVFEKDILSEFQEAQEDNGKISSSLSELAFIMAKAAEAHDEKKPLANLNQEAFVEWLEQFEPLDLTMAAEELIEVYTGNEKALSEVKKKVSGAVKEN